MPPTIPTAEPRGALPESSFKYNPLQHVRYLYTAFAQGLFYAAPAGSGFHWEAENQSSEIIITAEAPIKLETLNDRPAISFTRAPVGFYHLGFDDLDQYDFRTGRKVKSMLIPGTMVINCCSRNDLESEQMAWTFAEHLWLLRDLMMTQGFYDVGRNMQVGSPSAPGAIVEGEGADEWFCTSVTSPYHFYRTSSRTPLSTGIFNSVQLALALGTPCPIKPGVQPMVGAGGNPPFLVDRKFPPPFAPGAPDANALPLVPHPLNPAALVTVRPSRIGTQGLRPPRINGRTLITLEGQQLPISATTVEECNSSIPVASAPVQV